MSASAIAVVADTLPHFIPPFPPRATERLKLWPLLKALRSNLLALWPERSFQADFIQARLLRRRVFVCNSPETVQFALVAHNEDFERKSPQMRHALEPLLGDGLFVSHGETWKQRRRVITPIIHVSRLPLFAPLMVEASVEAADRWDAQLASGAAGIDALGEMARLTAEIICRTIFGRSLGADQAAEIVEGFSDYQRHVGQSDLLSLIGLPDWLPRLHGRAIARSTARIHGVLDSIIASHAARRKAGNVDQEPSIIRLLLDAQDEDAGGSGPKLDADALRNEAAVIFMAGHETTANSLAWTWFLLSQSPRVEALLHAELDTVLEGRAPTYADVGKLKYTRAVFEEALRLYPPVPLLTREAVRDTDIQGTPVPAGSLVMVVPWLLHRNPKHWDQPDAFIPERFLPENAAGRSRYIYVPFAIGPRICAGAAFGLTEGVLCLATLAQRFSLRLVPGTDVQPTCRLTLRPGDDLPMTLHRRVP